MNVIVSANRSLVKEKSGIYIKATEKVACIFSSTRRKEQL